MDKTIDMAREANLAKYGNGLREGVDAFIDGLKAFEALVRADERERVMNEPLTKAQWQRFEDEIRADEREACAALADKLEWADNKGVASAIRSRGNT